MKVPVSFLLCLLTLVPGCEGATAPPETTRSPATLECTPPFAPAPGFVEVTRHEVPQGDAVGVQVFYQGPKKERLVYTAGVLMDMFEHAPVADGLRMVPGGTASLFRRGRDRWILYWIRSDACSQYTIGGEGFTRAAFVGLLRGSGVLARP